MVPPPSLPALVSVPTADPDDPTTGLSPEETTRYARHILIPEVGAVVVKTLPAAAPFSPCGRTHDFLFGDAEPHRAADRDRRARRVLCRLVCFGCCGEEERGQDGDLPTLAQPRDAAPPSTAD